MAGIVWDGKIDFATFFDPRPEAVIGIQLLPFSPGSDLQVRPRAAGRRVAADRAAGGGEVRLWPDLFVMEALADPLAAVDDVAEVEAGNSRTWMRWWVLAHQP